MQKSGVANLPLHYGHVPKWLADRMAKLGLSITESILENYGADEFLKRMSDPFWFQSLGCVLGMDWHSSGITTSVLGALKRSINPLSKELGLFICGGKGKQSKATPNELLIYSERNGLNANQLIRSSKLVAKVDNTAVQDGYQLYLHCFILDQKGNWTVVQQGMQDASSSARRYHWHSASVKNFTETPHSGICGINQGNILDLTALSAKPSKEGIINLTQEKPQHILAEIQQLHMPKHHDVRAKDVDLKRLGAMLWLSHEKRPADFEELLLLEGLGPRTLQSLALVSEVIFGTPTRFKDPARFSFAHGGKDGHPFPVLTKVFDETIDFMNKAVQESKLGFSEKSMAVKALSNLAFKSEQHFTPNNNFDELINKERENAWKYGGKTVFGDSKPPNNNQQLSLFDF